MVGKARFLPRHLGLGQKVLHHQHRPRSPHPPASRRPCSGASSGGRVHPVAILKIVDANVRRPEGAKRVIGTLLGRLRPKRSPTRMPVRSQCKDVAILLPWVWLGCVSGSESRIAPPPTMHGFCRTHGSFARSESCTPASYQKAPRPVFGCANPQATDRSKQQTPKRRELALGHLDLGRGDKAGPAPTLYRTCCLEGAQRIVEPRNAVNTPRVKTIVRARTAGVSRGSIDSLGPSPSLIHLYTVGQCECLCFRPSAQ